jgi:DNA-3-methyladenine glycosylase II
MGPAPLLHIPTIMELWSVGQQLSVHAAAAIKQRLTGLFDARLPSPEELLATSAEQLRAIGFSKAKSTYVHDLAHHILDGSLSFDAIDHQTNEQIVRELTSIKGIGDWTAHMFLIFCVGRLDVLPVGDLGVRNGIRKLYGFSDPPTPEQITQLASTRHWHPYESVASWYIWRSLDTVLLD